MRNQHTFVKTVPLHFCTGCNVQKTAYDFYRANITKCKACHAIVTRAWKAAHPTHNRDHKLRNRYGMSTEQYDAMFAQQNGRCAICGLHQTDSKKTLEVDHDHETNTVRGLLCQNCNKSLGLMRDNPAVLLKAILYLGAH